MYEPPHPGEHIRVNCIERLYLGDSAAAELLGVDPGFLSDVVAGREDVSADLAGRLEHAFGGTARHWMQLQLNYNLWRAERSLRPRTTGSRTRGSRTRGSRTRE